MVTSAQPPGEESRDGLGPATSAAVYDYWLGGKDNLEIDRTVGAAVAESLPGIVETVRANRRFLVRAVRYLSEQGMRQFLDVGTGYPTSPNVHEVAQRISPDVRVAYVDYDVAVAAHGRALLAQDHRTVMVAGDARNPLGILQDRVVAGHLDWSRPVGLLMVAVLHFVSDEADPLAAQVGPAASVTTFRKVMAPGSAVVISHATPGGPQQADAMQRAVETYQRLAAPIIPRPPQAVAAFFDGFELAPPGLVQVDQWRVPGASDRWPRAYWNRRHIEAVSSDQINGVAGVGWLREGS